MATSQLIRLLHSHRLRVFTTGDLVTLSGISAVAATHALRRLAKQELVTRIKRGLWVNGLAADVSPYEAVSPLAAPWPAYVSLHSTLADYGLVEEIPQVVYAISAGRARRYRTAIGEFHFHHLPPDLIWGYEVRDQGKGRYLIAEPEKAFLDTIYLALVPRSLIQVPHKRSRRWRLDPAKLRRYAKRFGSTAMSNWLRENGIPG
jgi:predicted transcriptional regulator of viral defense system